jgi:hypothetical protein
MEKRGRGAGFERGMIEKRGKEGQASKEG